MVVNKVKEKVIPEHYEVTISFTTEQYNRLENNARWNGMSIEQYIKSAAQGNLPRGC